MVTTPTNNLSDTRSKATEHEIAVCAYFIWEQEGKPSGRALDHWLQAELQLAASIWHESLAWPVGGSALGTHPLRLAKKRMR